MTGEIDSDEGETSFSMCLSKETSACLETDRGGWDGSLYFSLVDDGTDKGIVGDEKFIVWSRAETLFAVPCHVVEGGKCSVRDEQVVEVPASDDNVVGSLDHVGQSDKG